MFSTHQEGNTLIFECAENLDSNTNYTVSISDDAENILGNELSAPLIVEFRTESPSTFNLISGLIVVLIVIALFIVIAFATKKLTFS